MLNKTKKMILLELNGREKPITLQELCQTLDLDPVKTREDFRRLWLDDLVSHPIGYGVSLDNPTLAITWIGRDQLQRQLDAEARPAPTPEPVKAPSRRRWTRVVFGRWGVLFWAVVTVLAIASLPVNR